MRWLTVMAVFILAVTIAPSCAVLNPGPDQPTICIDRQWSESMLFQDEESISLPPSEGPKRDIVRGLPKGSPIYNVPAKFDLYIYPSTLAVSEGWGGPYYFPILLCPAYVAPNGNFYGIGIRGDVQAIREGEVVVGGSRNEPKKAMKYLVDISQDIIPPSGLLFMSSPSGWTLIRVR